MKKVSFVIIIVAIMVTTAIGVQTAESPMSVGAWGIVVWAVSPYIYLAIMTRLISHNIPAIIVAVLAFLAGGFGAWGLVDTMFLNPDAQGGLAFIVLPLWQWVLLVLVTIPVYFLHRKLNRG